MDRGGKAAGRRVKQHTSGLPCIPPKRHPKLPDTQPVPTCGCQSAHAGRLWQHHQPPAQNVNHQAERPTGGLQLESMQGWLHPTLHIDLGRCSHLAQPRGQLGDCPAVGTRGDRRPAARGEVVRRLQPCPRQSGGGGGRRRVQPRYQPTPCIGAAQLAACFPWGAASTRLLSSSGGFLGWGRLSISWCAASQRTFELPTVARERSALFTRSTKSRQEGAMTALACRRANG